jgi:hypothetical protein
MKSIVCLVLFLFLSFLSFPTIIGLLDNYDNDISMVYSLSEEEEVHKTFSLKEAIKTSKQLNSRHYEMPTCLKIVTENHIQYDTVLEEIFSPPPEV